MVDEDEEDDDSLNIVKQLVKNGMGSADVYNDEEDEDEDTDDNLNMAVNNMGFGLYEDESPQLMQDDNDEEEMDEIAIGRKDPLWGRFRFPRFRFPRFRFPRVRFPRIRLPRVRLPRIRLPRIRLPRIRLPRIRLPRIRLPRIRLPRIRFRFRFLRKPKNPCPYSEAQVMSRIDNIRCSGHWKTFFQAVPKSTANEIVDGETFVNYCKPYTLCKACAPSSPWSSAACENKLNNQLQEFCKAISTDDAELLPWCRGVVSKIISYERSQTHGNNADLCKCGAGEAGQP